MKAEQKAQAIRVVRDRAEQERFYFFHDPQRCAYATVPVRNHRETWPVSSRDFRLWVKQTLYDSLGFAPNALMKSLLEDFETFAICRGPEHEVFVRVGRANGAVYIDLANELWQVIEITADGWRVLDDSPVKFRRPMGMKGLPFPAEGDLRELLQFLNLRSRADEVLLLTWLTFALHPNGPYPLLALSGAQGSGKSTAERVLRALIDPSQAELTTKPRSERDLAIAATNGHLIAMDNLSQITDQLSDSLCRVSTGGSFRTRKLYANSEEMLFTFRCPVIFSGIEELATRGDLLRRSVLIHLEPLRQYRDEEPFFAEFEEARPRIFGALLDVLYAGLQNAKKVEVPVLPSMADFARFGVAVEETLGFKPGEFLASYRENIARAGDVSLEASPVFLPMRDLLERQRQFSGTPVELLEKLTLCASDLARRHPRWPKAANQLSGEIARIEPNLDKAGIEVKRGRTRRGRFILLELRPQPQASDDVGDDPAAATSRDKSPFVNTVGAA